MASTYPTTLDSFTNPIAANPLTAPSHAQQHADINDAMEAVQTKLAIGNTVVGTYTAYTPTVNQITLGNGTVTSAYCQVNKLVHYYGKIVFGSTTTFVGGNVSLNVPLAINLGLSSPFVLSAFGTISFVDTSGGFASAAPALVNASAGAILLFAQNTAGIYITSTNISATVPFTWASGDYITWNTIYRTT